MSARKGNNQKRGQKYQNVTAFKNNMHDTTLKQKQINSLTVAGVCSHCKETIEWKIKYKKYKPLKAPRTCVKCGQKTIKTAYHTWCGTCASAAGVCEKCGKKEEVINKSEMSAQEKASQDSMLQQELKMLAERERRTFVRHMEKGCPPVSAASASSLGDDELDDDSDDEDDRDDDDDK